MIRRVATALFIGSAFLVGGCGVQAREQACAVYLEALSQFGQEIARAKQLPASTNLSDQARAQQRHIEEFHNAHAGLIRRNASPRDVIAAGQRVEDALVAYQATFVTETSMKESEAKLRAAIVSLGEMCR